MLPLPKDDGHPGIVANMDKLREELNNNRLNIYYDFLFYDPKITDLICISEASEELLRK